MSSRRVVTWGKLRAICKTNSIEIQQRGSEALLSKIATDGRKTVHVLSHHCCRSKSSVVYPQHLAAIKRKFRLTNRDFT